MKKNKGKRFLTTAIVLAGAFICLKKIAENSKADRTYENTPEEKNPLEGKKVIFVEDDNDPENADGVKGHLEAVGDSLPKQDEYDGNLKRMLDITISFLGLVLLWPLLLGIAVAIKIDDPGPVLFSQKRLGKNKKYFKLYKFRSMKMCTPHDVPTHMLDNPDQYITRVGRFLRAHSLDELPQIWNIFAGDMSIIGPRPGLWNQDVLTAERDKYGANDIKPGLTGWAQINGRDEIEIPEKAKLDGEYVEKESLLFDVKCFVGTISKVGHDDSVVEGGTGELSKEKDLKKAISSTEPLCKKKVLITGKDSYIWDSVKEYLDLFPEFYETYIFDTKTEEVNEEVFKGFDVVFNVAGIAHVKETDENRDLYYKVNRDLCVSLAENAKRAGVKQFINLSSMSVYGCVTGHIMKYTEEDPVNAYGTSKYEADKKLKQMASEDFKVATLRPPMVYGKGCKGNYQLLRKFAVMSPLFPQFENERSMIYIGNLCEFVKNIIDREEAGLFFPQNSEYVNTGKMVEAIAKYNNLVSLPTRLFNPAIKMVPLNVIKKVFGNLTYEKVDQVDKYSFDESVKLSEN